MKIQDQTRYNMGDLRVIQNERSTTSSTSFQKIMSSYSKELTQDHLQQLLEELDQQGQKLNDKPTFQELRKYKDLVKKFMGEVTNKGMNIYQSESWDPYSGNKTLKTVQVIDKKLVELTDQVLNQQNNGLSILEQIGEIKGLLINLYT
ncbi:YaaR family protein [Neobacillus sp. LXY-1]|uniref:YaaR family protein n=1 Tax=Neobacillus sp. LXY-1 TaxID=3379133 RepID=UPI003EDE9D02